MAYRRDPLSVRYDNDTNPILDRLYREASLPAVVEAFIMSPPNDPPDDRDGSLTMHERAFSRSLYHQSKLRGPRRSIRLDWGEATPKGRQVRITMFAGASGINHVEEHSESSYVQHPELRSRGLLPDDSK